MRGLVSTIDIRPQSKHGWHVKTIERNYFNKEKGVAMEIGLDMSDLMHSLSVPQTIVLLAGDGDFQAVIPRLQARGWRIEVWFYGNVAQAVRTLADHFENLEYHLHAIRLK